MTFFYRAGASNRQDRVIFYTTQPSLLSPVNHHQSAMVLAPSRIVPEPCAPWYQINCVGNRDTLKDVFVVKVTFEMLTVCVKQHAFSTLERMFLWKFRSLRDRKCLDPRGNRTPRLRITPLFGNFCNTVSFKGDCGSILKNSKVSMT